MSSRRKGKLDNAIDKWEMAFDITIMTAKLTIDKAGRVVIPKSFRDELHLSSGDSLEIESQGDEFILRPVREAATMFKENGMWVIKTGKPLTVEDVDAVIESVREERNSQILGPGFKLGRSLIRQSCWRR